MTDFEKRFDREKRKLKNIGNSHDLGDAYMEGADWLKPLIVDMREALKVHIDFKNYRTGQRITPELWDEMLNMSQAEKTLAKVDEFFGGEG